VSADQKLKAAFDEWRRLATAEGAAIRGSNWPVVADCQNALQQLQSSISHFMEEARQDGAGLEADRQAQENHFQAAIAELIEIERQNNALLADVRQFAQARFSQLEQAGHTLRQVQRSYSPASPPAWTSFS
jgi:lipopolysaccharide biosynthesis regulator YciM